MKIPLTPAQRRSGATRRTVVAAVLLGLPMLAGCSFGAADGKQAAVASQPEKVTFALDWLAQASNAGAFIALEKGYYSDANLDVTLQPGGTAATSIQVVAGGGAQFGLEYATQILEARSKGIDLVSLAPTFQQTPSVYLTHAGQSVTSIADFNDRTVYTQPSSAEWAYVVSKYGLTSATAVQFQGSYAAFAADPKAVAQGYATSSPAQLEAQGIEVESIPYDSASTNYGSSIFTTQKLIDSNPDLVRRFVAATVKGWEFIKDDPATASKILASQVPDLKAEEIEAEFERQVPFVFEGDSSAKGFGWQSTERWDAIAKLSVDWGIIPDESAATGAWSTEFLPAK